MTGLEAHAFGRADIHHALFAIFQEVPEHLLCHPLDYEYISGCGEDCLLPGPLRGAGLADMCKAEGSLLVCGRFFFSKTGEWPEGSRMEDFWNSVCETAVFVYDVSYIEIYSKDSAFLHRCFDSLLQMGDGLEVERIGPENSFRTSLRI